MEISLENLHVDIEAHMVKVMSDQLIIHDLRLSVL